MVTPRQPRSGRGHQSHARWQVLDHLDQVQLAPRGATREVCAHAHDLPLEYEGTIDGGKATKRGLGGADVMAATSLATSVPKPGHVEYTQEDAVADRSRHQRFRIVSAGAAKFLR